MFVLKPKGYNDMFIMTECARIAHSCDLRLSSHLPKYRLFLVGGKLKICILIKYCHTCLPIYFKPASANDIGQLYFGTITGTSSIALCNHLKTLMKIKKN